MDQGRSTFTRCLPGNVEIQKTRFANCLKSEIGVFSTKEISNVIVLKVSQNLGKGLLATLTYAAKR